MSREKLIGKNLEELKDVALSLGLPSYTARQLAEWMYVRKVKRLVDMTNISKAGREKLLQNYDLGLVEPAEVIESSDGTKK
ncbi:MAG TPA: 23S rRNA (adenine(2503)-C(2))-methyltransferase RlmN, partial [Rikenellaceae bacterium]|nr:23S rRNA (adenine(2503)-C(2))-methyltransferase RlmN [Rikenellaceae bacterium]